MKKSMRYIVTLLLTLVLALSLCACGQTGGVTSSDGLDLDYVGEDTATEEESPWYSWITDAFSFGKKETKDTTTQTTPDSVEEYYSQGTEAAQSGKKDTPSSSGTNTAEEQTTTPNKPNKTDKTDDTSTNTPDADTPQQDTTPSQPESSKNTVTIVSVKRNSVRNEQIKP